MATELLFLGTGAADWPEIPADDVKFDTDKKIRRRSTMLINEKYLIDCSPFSYDYAEFLGVDLSEITDIFLTHSHIDHLYRDSLLKFARAAKSKITFHCHKDAVGRIPLEGDELELIKIAPFELFDELVTEDFIAVPLQSNHTVENSPETTVHYVFKCSDKTFFYGCDGAWLLSKTWDYLCKCRFDLVIFDGTVGDYEDDWRIATHNSIPMIRIMVKAMKTKGIIDDNTTIMLSHFARTLHAGIKETEELLSKDGMCAAYDSLRYTL